MPTNIYHYKGHTIYKRADSHKKRGYKYVSALIVGDTLTLAAMKREINAYEKTGKHRKKK